jgi:hypothetical protein
MHRNRQQIDAKADEMRLWARANGHRAVARKLDWDATFTGWIRRDWGNVNGAKNGNELALSTPSTDLIARSEGERGEDDFGQPTSPSYALKAAKQLVGCFPHARPPEPETYAGALGATLAQYPQAIVNECVDPRVGLVRKLRFPPTVASIVEWCDARLAHYDTLARYQAREKRPEREFTDADRALAPIPRRSRLQSSKAVDPLTPGLPTHDGRPHPQSARGAAARPRRSGARPTSSPRSRTHDPRARFRGRRRNDVGRALVHRLAAVRADRAQPTTRAVLRGQSLNAALPQSIEVGRASCRRVNARALRPIAHELPIDTGKPANIALGRLARTHQRTRGLDDFVVRHRLHGVHCVPRFASRLLARAVIGPGRRQLSGPALSAQQILKIDLPVQVMPVNRAQTA